MALGEYESADRAPVVSHELYAIDPQRGEQSLQVIRLALDRVIQMPALRRASEAEQVGRETPGQLEEGLPVSRGCGHSVQVQRRGTRGARHAEKSGRFV